MACAGQAAALPPDGAAWLRQMQAAAAACSTGARHNPGKHNFFRKQAVALDKGVAVILQCHFLCVS
jgi:hypothetical protein